MAEPSKTRNFFGRVVDRILPGTNYDRTTGQYSNVGKGIAGLGARLAATAFAGPLAGQLVGKGASYLIDHTGNKVGGVRPEGVTPYAPVDAGYTQGGVALPAISNLGLGAQSPGNTWAGYMQGAGSANNFGNTQFGSGSPSIPGSWNPQSQWGQQLTAPPETQGSLGGFGNNVGGFTGASGRDARGSYTGGAVQSAGMFGGNLVNENMLQLQNRWRGSPLKHDEPETSRF